MIDVNEIKRFLSDGQKSRLNLLALEKVESTNDVAFDLVPDSVVIADEQTKGRGREGRAFYSGKGGIYMSVTVSQAKIERLTVAVVAAVAKAIETVLQKTVFIKWVNDVVFQGKKVCGILCESRVCADEIKAVAGIGINLCGNIPYELKEIAGTLGDDCQKKEQLIAQILNNFYSEWDFMEYYRKKSLVVGKKIEADGKTYQAVGIDGDGGLILESGSERVVKRTGEIRVALRDLL